MAIQAVCDVQGCDSTAPLQEGESAIPLGWSMLRIPMEDIAQAKHEKRAHKPPAGLGALADVLGVRVAMEKEGPCYRQVVACGKHDLPKFKP